MQLLGFEDRRKIKILLFGFLSKSRFFCKLYYLAFSRSFDDEFQSLMTAKYIYWRDLTKPGLKNFRLRRCVHVIEKGLTRPDRKAFFSKLYVQQIIKIVSDTRFELDPKDRKWATDVLDEYFRVVKGASAAQLREEYFTIRQSEVALEEIVEVEPRSLPFSRPEPENLPDLSQLHMLALHRRSVRYFHDRPVDSEELSKAFAIAGLAPSACNRQAFRFDVYLSKSDVLNISDLVSGATSFRHNIPCLIVVVAENRFSFQEKDRNIPFIDASLSTMLLCLALETIGLSSCIMNWPEDDELNVRARAELGHSDAEKIVFMIAVGHADRAIDVPGSAKNLKVNIQP